MPEWYLLIGALMILAVLSGLWPPLRYSLPLLAMAVGAPLVQAVWRTNAAVLATQTTSRTMRLKHWLCTAFLHWMQPIARLYGRLTYGFTRWRRRGHRDSVLPWPRTMSIWSETWQNNANHLQSLETALCDEALLVKRGRVDDRWDLEVGGGLFGNARALMAVEKYSAGKQKIQFRIWSMWPAKSMVLSMLFALLSVGATLDRAYVPALILAGVALLAACRMVQECAWAMSGVIQGITQLRAPDA